MKWLCRCSCFNEVVITGRCLREGSTKSCGCLRKEMLSAQSKVLHRKKWHPQEIDENTYGIPLSSNKIALIDKEDYDKVKDYSWFAQYDEKGKRFYARTGTHGTKIRMHRLILDAKESQIVDHKDHDGLNNRKNNLRLCEQSQNCMNKLYQSNNTSGYRGVSFHKGKNKYQATIMVKRKQIYLGSFDTAIEAFKVYQEKARELFGAFYCKEKPKKGASDMTMEKWLENNTNSHIRLEYHLQGVLLGITLEGSSREAFSVVGSTVIEAWEKALRALPESIAFLKSREINRVKTSISSLEEEITLQKEILKTLVSTLPKED
jgi:hypothetical protein